MSLFPFVSDEVIVSANAVTPRVREYEIDFKKNRLTGRIVEGVDAIAVWAYLALKATRYKWVIYSWYYGEEYTNLIGYSYSEEYVQSEVKRYMEECLLENEHILELTNMDITLAQDRLTVRFNMVTDVGSKEVEMYV